MQAINIPINLWYWLMAVSPIIVMSFLLLRLRWTAQQAGAIGMFVAGTVAFMAFKAPPETLAIAGAKGIWDSISILLVIWPALFLYHTMNQAGGYEAMRQGIVKFSRNELFIVIALGWVFASFLQGIDGFGTPIVVVAPLLVAIGVKPVYAVAIPLIAHIWAKFFGTMAVGWLATLQVVELNAAMAASTALQSAILLMLQVVLGGFWIVWMYGRWPAIKHAWPLVLIIAGIHGIGQIIVVLFDPVLSAFIPATAAMLALYPLSRWKRFAEPIPDMPIRPAMRTDLLQDVAERKAPMELATSFAPYILLTVLTLSGSLILPVKSALAQLKFGMSFPAADTGFGISNSAVDVYSALAPMHNPGFFVLITALITMLVYRSRGYYKKWAEQSAEQPAGLFKGLCASAVPASVPIISFLVMARLMDHSGQNEVLAYGISAIAPAYAFAFLSNGIGIIGAFATSSSTSSNVLLSDLQLTLAKLKGLPEATILASQSAGGAIGNAIAPANLVLGASTAGISGKEGEIMRKTLPWTIVAFLLTGLATIVLLMFNF